MIKRILSVSTALLLCLPVFSQLGNLFIIGGGHKTDDLMRQLIATAQINDKDYIAILPMSSAEPDTGYYYIKEDFAAVCKNKVINFNFNDFCNFSRLWKKIRLIGHSTHEWMY